MNSSRKHLNWLTPICTNEEELGLSPTTPFIMLVKLSTKLSNVIVVDFMSGSDSRNDSNVSYHHDTWCHMMSCDAIDYLPVQLKSTVISSWYGTPVVQSWTISRPLHHLYRAVLSVTRHNCYYHLTWKLAKFCYTIQNFCTPSTTLYK